MGALHINLKAIMKNDANTGATCRELCETVCEQHGIGLRTFQKQFAKLCGRPFAAKSVCSPDEVAKIREKYPVRKLKVEAYKAAVPVANEQPGIALPLPKKAFFSAFKPRKNMLLWLCLVLSLACSVPNMFSIMVAIKGNEVLAAIVTATFTVAPLLLIAYGIKGWQKTIAYVPIAVEIFCNSAGFYGGMTGLQHSLYVEPTKFLHMVTTMTNSGNEGTAFILSISLAICISALAIVPVYQLEKHAK